ncbi:integrase family protein [Desulfosudis oleivorans Hxd3]|uniref:Integrase family protein n=2 Tax=Desulfosudis TaxID=2904716 RepID=A8ZUN3_DESOH|nr:integrase family protein [Desulfosudis oleivorans Hxd3]
MWSPYGPPQKDGKVNKMAILIRCIACKTETKLTAKKCPGCGAAFPVRNKTYKVTVKHGGKKKTKLVDNLDLAREIETKLKHDITRGTFHLQTQKQAPTLDAFWDKDYLPWIRSNKKSWYEDAINYQTHLAPKLGQKRLDAITQLDIERLLSGLRKGTSKRGKPYAAATIKHQIVLLTRMFNVAARWGKYTGPNPCKLIAKPRLNNQKTGFLTDDELTRLLDVLEQWPDRMSAGFIAFLLHTGLRRGELFRLTWQDVNMDRQTLTVRDPKGGRDTVLPLSEKAIDALNSLPREHETPFVFYGRNGAQRADFRHPWYRIKQAAALPEGFRLHDLRHHFASALVSAGTNLYTVQALLTHKSAAMTQRYAHLSDQALRDAVKLSDDLSKKATSDTKAMKRG